MTVLNRHNSSPSSKNSWFKKYWLCLHHTEEILAEACMLIMWKNRCAHGRACFTILHFYEQVTKYREYGKQKNKGLIYLLCMTVSRPLLPQLLAQNSMHTPHIIINAIIQCMPQFDLLSSTFSGLALKAFLPINFLQIIFCCPLKIVI